MMAPPHLLPAITVHQQTRHLRMASLWSSLSLSNLTAFFAILSKIEQQLASVDAQRASRKCLVLSGLRISLTEDELFQDQGC
jgi:hypothetical protein